MSIFVIYPLHTSADTSQHFIWYSAYDIRECCNRKMFSENLHTVTLITFDICHIDHGYVHTDVADIVSFLAVYQAVAFPVAQSPVQSVSISYWYCCHDAITFEHCLAAVSDRFARPDIMFLKYCSIKC